jgi:CHASE3 domain sensor protein
MWQLMSLRTRLFLILGSLVVITLVGASVTVWYTYQIGFLFKNVVEKDLEAFETAVSLENAVVNQKGFVTYYFLDGDPGWLQKLGEYREAFKVQLEKTRLVAKTTGSNKTIDQIESAYVNYIQKKDKVIALYKAGKRKSGAVLHKEVRDQFFNILRLCEVFKRLHLDRIESARLKTQTQAKRLRIIAVTGMWTAIVLGGTKSRQ